MSRIPIIMETFGPHKGLNTHFHARTRTHTRTHHEGIEEVRLNDPVLYSLLSEHRSWLWSLHSVWLHVRVCWYCLFRVLHVHGCVNETELFSRPTVSGGEKVSVCLKKKTDFGLRFRPLIRFLTSLLISLFFSFINHEPSQIRHIDTSVLQFGQ